MCWWPATAARPAADAAAKLDGVRKVLLAEADELERASRRTAGGAHRRLAGGYDTIIAPATDHRQERHAARRRASRRHAGLRNHRGDLPDTFKRPIYAGNAIQTVQSTDAKKVITVRTASFQAAPEGGSAANRNRAGRRRSRPLDLRREQSFEQRPSRTNLGQDHHLGRPRAWFGGKVPGSHPAGRRQARRGRWRLARRGRCGLRAQRLAGRARPARSLRPISTSRSAFRAPSSISPA